MLHNSTFVEQSTVDPVTLSPDWNRVGRLLLLTGMSVVGSIGNVFMISAIMIEDHLKKRGNSFLVNIALSDILVTGLIYPASTVAIVGNLTDLSNTICNVQYFIAILSCFVTFMTFSVIAVENYCRLFASSDCYNCLSPSKITFIIISIWVISFLIAIIQFTFHLGPDYCHKTSGLLPYQVTTGIIFIFVPGIFTFLCYSLIIFRYKRIKSQQCYRFPIEAVMNFELAMTNLGSFIFFLIFWLPFLFVLWVLSVADVTNKTFYNLAWFALSKSCLNNLVYGLTNKHFRKAYFNLLNYCCCKTSVTFSRRQREPPVRPSGDVRVHIIPQYNMYSPQRERNSNKTSSKRGGSGRAGTNRANGREVYEL